jgi:hypothetical protein
VTVIAVSGDLRSAGFEALDRLVTEALDRGHRHVVLDLHAVPSIEPQALGLLWEALRGVRRRGAPEPPWSAGAVSRERRTHGRARRPTQRGQRRRGRVHFSPRTYPNGL